MHAAIRRGFGDAVCCLTLSPLGDGVMLFVAAGGFVVCGPVGGIKCGAYALIFSQHQHATLGVKRDERQPEYTIIW